MCTEYMRRLKQLSIWNFQVHTLSWCFEPYFMERHIFIYKAKWIFSFFFSSFYSHLSTWFKHNALDKTVMWNYKIRFYSYCLYKILKDKYGTLKAWIQSIKSYANIWLEVYTSLFYHFLLITSPSTFLYNFRWYHIVPSTLKMRIWIAWMDILVIILQTWDGRTKQA